MTITTPHECWPWTGGRFSNGYGSITVDGRSVGTHRLAFRLTHGRWPRVCRHSCDNPICCNPRHLLDGTHQDNKDDAIARGRSYRGGHSMAGKAARGEGHGHAKLTDDEVAEIRRRAALGGRGVIAQLARAYKTPYGTIHSIVRGRSRAEEVADGR